MSAASSADRVVLSAPAKLTRSLRVVGMRPDGYHLIEAEMVSVGLADTLEIGSGSPTSELEVLDEIDWIGEVRDDVTGAITVVSSEGSRNLVTSALAAVSRTAAVRLTKRIPPGAGLGGGSSDAAAILRWAGCTDTALAVGLGADVPFCVTGGRAHVAGIGEQVSLLPSSPGLVLLVVPHLVVPTPAVYGAWDSLGGPVGDFGNDLEPAALAVMPVLRWWRDLMAAALGERPRLAGSGGTWFVEGALDDRTRLAEAGDQIRAEIVAGREGALVTLVETLG